MIADKVFEHENKMGWKSVAMTTVFEMMRTSIVHVEKPQKSSDFDNLSFHFIE